MQKLHCISSLSEALLGMVSLWETTEKNEKDRNPNEYNTIHSECTWMTCSNGVNTEIEYSDLQEIHIPNFEALKRDPIGARGGKAVQEGRMPRTA